MHDIHSIIRIRNDSAQLFASSAVWSPQERQLVAIQITSPTAETLKAVKASLMTNSARAYVVVDPPDHPAQFLHSARRGLITVSGSLEKAHARGHLQVWLHPLTGDPSESTADFFYLVTTPHEDLNRKFAERLNLALQWPVLPEWATYLRKVGLENELVSQLPQSGQEFSTCLRVSCDSLAWQSIISAGLQKENISITKEG